MESLGTTIIRGANKLCQKRNVVLWQQSLHEKGICAIQEHCWKVVFLRLMHNIVAGILQNAVYREYIKPHSESQDGLVQNQI